MVQFVAQCNASSVQSKTDGFADAVLSASRVLVSIAARSIAEKAHEVTLAQFRALVVLQSRGPQSLQDLATELDVVPSTATRMCDRLVDKGLVTRSLTEEDRRKIRLEVTQSGRDVVATVSRRRRSEIRRIVAQMDLEERESLVEAMEAFALAAGEVPESQWYLGWT